jgi:hypothetical protein
MACLASFGNRDLLPHIQSLLKQLRKSESQILSSKVVKEAILDKFYRVMTKLKVNKVSIEARKKWLINNSRCSEVLDSEFYY